MAYTSYRLHEIVKRAVSHEWSVPEFQRGFVWKATQVRDLAESLWLDYPVGNILIWDSRGKTAVETRSVADAQLPSLWLVDGQQRTTALCILNGRRPYWWQDGQAWNDLLKRYDIRFDIDTMEPPFFVVANAVIRRNRTNRYVEVSKLIGFDLEKDEDQKELRLLAKAIKTDYLCAGRDADEVKTRLERVCRIRNREIIGVTIDNDLEDVVEIFARLNSTGTRVKEADIYLGIVAARSPGWVRETFLPFLDQLERDGFNIGPNQLFMCLTAVGAKRIRFKNIDDGFWSPSGVRPSWDKTAAVWPKIINFLETWGILTNATLPSNAVLVTLSALFDKFPAVERNRTGYWLFQALRYGRYSGSGTSSLEEDLRDIEQASNGTDAVAALLRRIRAIEPITKDEFLRDYGDNRFGRLLLYVLAYNKGAEDWSKEGGRIAFYDAKLIRGFAPQFHHVFPRDFLDGKVKPEQIEALANIAIIGATTNIRISNKDPLDYFDRYGIDEKKRAQQYVEGEVTAMTVENFPAWLDARAERLAQVANAFLDGLDGGE